MATIATSPTAPRPAVAVRRGRYALVGLGAIVAAALANALVHVVGDALIGYDPRFVELGSAVGIAIFTTVPATGAVLVYGALLRFARRPARTFAIVAAVVLAISIIPDLTYIPMEPGATAGQAAVLVTMHVVAAAILTGMLTGLARPRDR